MKALRSGTDFENRLEWQYWLVTAEEMTKFLTGKSWAFVDNGGWNVVDIKTVLGTERKRKDFITFEIYITRRHRG